METKDRELEKVIRQVAADSIVVGMTGVEWSADCEQFFKDIAQAVREHLEKERWEKIEPCCYACGEKFKKGEKTETETVRHYVTSSVDIHKDGCPCTLEDNK